MLGVGDGSSIFITFEGVRSLTFVLIIFGLSKDFVGEFLLFLKLYSYFT
jgi:hypothetical protein